MRNQAAIAAGLPVPDDAPQIMARAFRDGQAVLGALVIRDVLTMWQQMDPYAVRASWPALRSVIIRMTQERWLTSALNGGAYYSRARAMAIVAGEIHDSVEPFAPLVPEVPEVPVLGEILDIAGPWTMLGGISRGQSASQAMSNAGVLLAGSVARLILQAGRSAVTDSVKADPVAVAWMRTLGPRPCAFCAMLASRGAVYKTEQIANFEAHTHCMCGVAPAFSRNQVARLFDNDLYRLWKKITAGYSGKNAINAWRRYWDNRPGQEEEALAA